MLILNKLVTVEKIIYTILIFASAVITRSLIKRSLTLLFDRLREKIKTKKFVAKTKTLKSLLQNVVDVTVSLIAVLMALSGWGINIAPILTGAGILGLGISFGSQSLVKDLISGFFIIWEDQFNVGDVVKIGGFEGAVHQITLRMTVLKDKEDKLIFIPNSQIKAVVRYPKG